MMINDRVNEVNLMVVSMVVILVSFVLSKEWILLIEKVVCLLVDINKI